MYQLQTCPHPASDDCEHSVSVWCHTRCMTAGSDASDSVAQRLEVYRQQVDHIHRSIGHFMVAFSGIVQAMEFSIVMAMGGQVQRATRALLSEYTVGPLAKAWRSVLIEAYGSEVGTGSNYRKELAPDDEVMLSALSREVGTIDEIRNDLAHGTWLVGWGNDETVDWSEAGFSRVKNAGTGVDFEAGKLAPMLKGKPTADVLDGLSVRAEVIASALQMFTGGLRMNLVIPHDPPLKGHLHLAGKGGSLVVYVATDGRTCRGSDGSVSDNCQGDRQP